MPGLGLGLGLETPRRRLGGASLLAAMALVEPNGHWNSVEGPGWIGTNGSMGEPGIGDPVGLLPDVSQWGGKKQDAFIAGQAHVLADPDFDTGTGWVRSSDSTISFSAGHLVFSDAAFNHHVDQTVLVAGRTYYFSVDVESVTSGVISLLLANLTVQSGLQPGVTSGVFTVPASPNTLDAGIASKSSATTARVNSFRLVELPGNHAIAGAPGSPSDTARGTAGDGTTIFNGTNSFYGLLNGIAVSDIGAIIMVGARPSTDTKTIGLGAFDSNGGTLWFSNNNHYYGLRNTWQVGPSDIETGNFVLTHWRNSGDEILRKNGVPIGSLSTTPATVAFDVLGRSNLQFQNGPINALIVLPVGVDLAMIQAWEAYGRTLNQAVFP